MAESLVQAMAGIERDRLARRNRNKAQLIQGIGTAMQIEERRNTMKAQEAFVTSSLADLQTTVPGYTPGEREAGIDPLTYLKIEQGKAQAFGIEQGRVTQSQRYEQYGATDAEAKRIATEKGIKDPTKETLDSFKDEIVKGKETMKATINNLEATGYLPDFYTATNTTEADYKDPEQFAGAFKKWADGQSEAKAIKLAFDKAVAKKAGTGKVETDAIQPFEKLDNHEKESINFVKEQFKRDITTNEQLEIATRIKKQLIDLVDNNEDIVLNLDRTNTTASGRNIPIYKKYKEMSKEEIDMIEKINSNLINMINMIDPAQSVGSHGRDIAKAMLGVVNENE